MNFNDTRESVDKTSIECRDPQSYSACYNAARDKINECVPGRGDTIKRIHESLYHQFCKDGGGTVFHGKYYQLSKINYLLTKLISRSKFIEKCLWNPSELSKHTGESCSPNYEIDNCVSNDAFEAWESLDVCT